MSLSANTMKNLTFIGVGRLGLCSALIFEKAGYNVLGVDIFPGYVKNLNNKQYKSHEPKVVEYLKNAKNSSLIPIFCPLCSFSSW